RRVWRALLDPAFEKIDFRSGQGSTRLGRWHGVVGIRGRYAPHQLTARCFARHDCPGSLVILNGFVTKIQAELGFARTFVRTVATETLARNERANLRTEID